MLVEALALMVRWKSTSLFMQVTAAGIAGALLCFSADAPLST